VTSFKNIPYIFLKLHCSRNKTWNSSRAIGEATVFFVFKKYWGDIKYLNRSQEYFLPAC
jgi:hypothetical protein